MVSLPFLPLDSWACESWLWRNSTTIYWMLSQNIQNLRQNLAPVLQVDAIMNLLKAFPPFCQASCFRMAAQGVLRCAVCCAKSLQLRQTLCDPMTTAHRAPLSRGFSRQEYWSGLPFPFLGELPNPGIEPRSLPHCRQMLYPVFQISSSLPPSWHSSLISPWQSGSITPASTKKFLLCLLTQRCEKP